MALRLDGRHYGELYDYWGGLRDLRKGLVRVLHSLSFVDDPTRVMRAVRFEQRFGFRIEERTLQLLKEARPMIRQVSGERLRHELNLILGEERAIAMLNRLQELDLLSAIDPALNWLEASNPLMERVLFASISDVWQQAGLPEKIGNLPQRIALAWITWLVQYRPDEVSSIVQRLRLTNEVLESVLSAKKLQADLPALSQARPSQVTARFDEVPLSALYAVYLLNLTEESCRLIERYLSIWRKRMPFANGDTLRQMQIPPGPHYRDILAKLRAAWLDEQINSKEMEDQLLLELTRNLPRNG